MPDPWGVLPGAIFSAATRAPWGGRSKWLDSANWGRVARFFSGRPPAPPPVTAPVETGSPNLERIANPAIYGKSYWGIPVEPEGKSRV